MLLRKIIMFISAIFFMSCANAGVVLHDSQGNTINSADLKGKWVIVNYWAGWCRGCVEETPELNHFYKTHLSKNLVMYGVNFDQLAADDLRHAIDKTKISYPVLVEDPAKIWKLDDVNVLPMTFIISPKGHVVKEIVGPSTEENLLTYLQELQALPEKHDKV